MVSIFLLLTTKIQAKLSFQIRSKYEIQQVRENFSTLDVSPSAHFHEIMHIVVA